MNNQKTGKRILLVDDDDALRQSLAEQLALHEEFDTAEAETAGKGIERAKAETFDLILLDVGLPDMDGREACRLMRRNGVRCPVIMLTGRGHKVPPSDLARTNIQHLLPKPFSGRELLTRVAEFIPSAAPADVEATPDAAGAGDEAR